MRRAERLFRLIRELRRCNITRAADLASMLEVSVTTIYRDIAHLQGSGVPIEGEAGVGYLLRPGFDLPPMTFTYDQLDALAAGLAFVERAGDANLADAAREVRSKIQAGLPDPDRNELMEAPFLSFHQVTNAPMDITELRRAIRDRYVVALTYRDSEARVSRRRLWPLLICSLNDGWTISGWCELRQDFRTFRLDRIEFLETTDTKFKQDETNDLHAFLLSERTSHQPELTAHEANLDPRDAATKA